MPKDKKILILGLGSDILMDDGIALKIVEKLKSALPDNSINFETALAGGFDLITVLEGYKQIFIIDTIINKDNNTDYVKFYNISNFPEPLHLSNHHEISFKVLLETSENLGISITKNIFIITIKGEEYFKFGKKLSNNIENNFNTIFKKILNFVNSKIKFEKS